MQSESKTCSGCGRALPLDAFKRRSDRPSGITSRCKECYAATVRTPRLDTDLSPSHFCEHRTLAEVAAELGITKERVRQIETKALRKLRMDSLLANWNPISEERRAANLEDNLEWFTGTGAVE
jgi:hypothetical protein